MRWTSTRFAISAAWSAEIVDAGTLCMFQSARFCAERWLLVTSAALAKSRPPAATGTTKKPSRGSARRTIFGTSTSRMTVEFSTSGVMNRTALAVVGIS